MDDDKPVPEPPEGYAFVDRRYIRCRKCGHQRLRAEVLARNNYAFCRCEPGREEFEVITIKDKVKVDVITSPTGEQI